MTPPVFMSQEHVDIMNTQLSAAPELAEVAARMPRSYELQYTLHDAKAHRTEYWLMYLGPDGVRFSLEPSKTAADLTFVGDYWRMIDRLRARAGDASSDADAGLQTVGDLGTLEAIAEVFAAAQAIGAVPVSWPE